MQKKLSIIISSVIVIILFLLGAYPVFGKIAYGREAYQYTYSSNCKISDYVLPLFKTGEAGILKDGVKIEEVIFDFKAKIVFVEEIDGTENYYCYSGKIKGYTAINGKKINLHFAKKQNLVKVGSPIIFGSF